MQMADLIVFVVVDPNFGDLLDGIAEDAPVWIVDTPTNRTACDRVWKKHADPDYRKKAIVTRYAVTNTKDRLENLLNIVPELETHHGVVEGNDLRFPRGFLLEVVGLTLSDGVAGALRTVGFKSFTNTTSGFQGEY